VNIVFFLIFLLVFLTLLSGFFSVAETAFFSLSSSKIHAWRHSSDPRCRHVAWLLARSRYLLVLIFMLDNISDIFLQNAASDLSDLFGGGWLLKVGVPLVLILLFGEFLPKYIGMLRNESIAIHSASFFVAIERFTAPFQRFITSFAEVASRIVFFFLKQEPPLSSKQLETAITTCEAQGILSSAEASLITHTLQIEKKDARELMIPRSAMQALKRSELSPSYIKGLTSSSKISSFLIVDETTDRPIGVLSNATALSSCEKSLEPFLQQASKKLFFVPESMPATRLLQEFSSRKAVMACVIDEHGCISGYIEWAALLQEILGFTAKISAKEVSLLRQKQTSITLPGTTPLETINELFGTTIESKFYATTLGGYLAEVLDMIPQAGASYATPDLLFKVLSANEKVVHQVFIQRKNGKSTPKRGGS